MKTFKYDVCPMAGTERDDQFLLDEYGKGGWELVTVIQIPSSGNSRREKITFLGYFKKCAE